MSQVRSETTPEEPSTSSQPADGSFENTLTPPVLPTPVEILALARRYRELDTERREKEKEAEHLASLAHAVKQALIASMTATSSTKLGDNDVEVRHTLKRVYGVQDWDKLYKWIAETGSWDVLQRRVTQAAVADRIAAGVYVDGIEGRMIDDIKVITPK